MFLSLGDLLVMFHLTNHFLLAAGVLLYFVPMLIACQRDHPNAAPTIIINLFLGWTLVGWVIALAWSASAVHPTRA